MVKANPIRKLRWVATGLGLVFAGLAVRLVWLQVIMHPVYAQIAEGNTVQSFLREGRRGDILDAKGNPLATSIPVKRVYANPERIGPYYKEVAKTLAPLLSYDEQELAARLKPMVVRTNKDGSFLTNRYVSLARKIELNQWQQVTQAMATLEFNFDEKFLPRSERRFISALRRGAIGAIDDQRRHYPAGPLAAHVIGYVSDVEKSFGRANVSEVQGVAGIESMFNSKLTGVRGWRLTEADIARREIVVNRQQEVEARPGLNVVLTIDSVIQQAVEAELGEAMKKHSPITASAVVVRPRTGEILAMATLPNYDPNRILDKDTNYLRNRIIMDNMEPGSTFKIVVAAAGFNENAITLEDTFDCENGVWAFRGSPLHDDHGGYSVLTVQNIIAKSSNIGSAKIAVYKLGEQKLYDYIKAFGFGARSGIALGGEEVGQVNPVKKWDKVAISRIPIGHAVGVTHLQMVMAMSAIANGGKLMRPLIVRQVEDNTGQVFTRFEPQVVRQVISEKAARQTVQALKAVVSKEGTAITAEMDHYTVAGKTGTAWKVIDGRYARGKYISSFIGFLPADNPEVCISVVLDDPHKGYYGGRTAAPVFKRIAEHVSKYLKIRPDREPEADILTEKGAKAAPLKTAAVTP